MSFKVNEMFRSEIIKNIFEKEIAVLLLPDAKRLTFCNYH